MKSNSRKLKNNAAANGSSVEKIVVEYQTRRENGERPDIEEYCNLHPQLAEELRQIVRTMKMAEFSVQSGETHLPVQDEADPLPKTIGEYRILREIGRGGMGQVYEAEHLTLDRRVALKVLYSDHSRNEFAIQRFHREARAIASLHHTSIVPLFEVGEDNGKFFLAMQLIDGKNLAQVISELRQIERAPNWATRRK